MVLQRGMRDKLDKYIDLNNQIMVEMSISGPAVYDFCCFGVDSADKLSDERYMVFYNQTSSPNGEITYTNLGNTTCFNIWLSRLPMNIQKLVFTVSIDGNSTMGNISGHSFVLKQNGNPALNLNMSGSDFSLEKAIITVEIYRKETWRINAIARGFNGGLGDLLRNYGGEEAAPSNTSANPAPVNPGSINQGQPYQNLGPMNQGQPYQNPGPMNPGPMNQGQPYQNPGPMNQGQSYQNPGPMNQGQPYQNPGPMNQGQPYQNPGPMNQGQPYQNPGPMNPGQPYQNPGPVNQIQGPTKISLEKKLEAGAPQLVSLAKPIKVQLEKHNLQNVIARVALVMDISGSMTSRYADGTVQEIVNHILPLAVQFDDHGELDFWYYGSKPKRMNSVNMQNYKGAVPSDWKNLMKQLGYGNNEPLVMEPVISEYKKSKLPAYVIFVTDGGVGSANKIKSLLTSASKHPIFWQFVGVGGYGYGILEELDNMGGRYVDNANFFALDDFKSISDNELYSRLLNEFPSWLREIRSKGMI